MDTLLFWVYVANASLLVAHEIDSAYWEEWDLFRLPGGIGLFVWLHVPIAALVIVGAVLAADGGTAGSIMSLVLAGSGLFAFGIHTYFTRQGREECSTLASRLLLWAILIVSLVQVAVVVAS
jgi:hypothetical protein